MQDVEPTPCAPLSSLGECASKIRPTATTLTVPMLIRNLLDLSVADALRLSHPHNVVYCIDPASKHCTALRA